MGGGGPPPGTIPSAALSICKKKKIVILDHVVGPRRGPIAIPLGGGPGPVTPEGVPVAAPRRTVDWPAKSFLQRTLHAPFPHLRDGERPLLGS